MPAITSMAAATPPVICWKLLELGLAREEREVVRPGPGAGRGARAGWPSPPRSGPGTSSARLGTVAMWMVSPPPFFTCGNCSSKVVIGMATKLSLLPPKMPPLCSKMPMTW